MTNLSCKIPGEIGMSDAPACFWCARPFEPHRGGSRQTFCRVACRAAYHKATRQWCERAIAEGRLSVEMLRNTPPAAYTLPGFEAAISPQSDIGSSPDSALSEPMARFVVEVSYYTIEMLVGVRWLRADQQDDLFAIINALKRFGRTPSVLRVV
jgi:hypothetical protein